MVIRPLLVAGLLVLTAITLLLVFSGEKDEEVIRDNMSRLCALAEMDETDTPIAAAVASREMGAFFTSDVYFQQGTIPYTVTSRSEFEAMALKGRTMLCLLYTSPSPRDATLSRMPSSA